jgi:hypothetical protein
MKALRSADGISDILNAILRITALNDPGDIYRLVSVCEEDADGEAVSRQVEVVIPPGLRDANASVRVRLDAIVKLMQGLKDFKQPICSPFKPKITGQLVTVNFSSSSDEVPSKNRVLKTLSYRDQLGQPEAAHLAHWDGFSYDTGGAIVTSKGLPWGVVQVWASTVDEGKRVIAHAAAIAGVDLSDPKHEWVLSSTDHPRYGRQARVYPVAWDRTGRLMISKRIGPSGSPSYERDP